MNESIPQKINNIATQEEVEHAIEEGRAVSTEAGAYLRLERATRELHDIAHDKSIPKQLRIRLRHIVGDMELSEKDAYELHIAKLHAEKISSRDTLTGLPNRNAFEKALSARTNHAMRFTTDVLYAIYIDIDKFKQINDIYGHDAGDVYLKFIAYSTSVVKRIA